MNTNEKQDDANTMSKTSKNISSIHNPSQIKFPSSNIYKKLQTSRTPLSVNFEITARCNNNCRHCYINLPEDDSKAALSELTIDEIEHIADQAVQQGVLWGLITGGEPLLRPDFSEIYLLLKKKGLLVSVFTNACLIDESHINLFKKYKPRELEVSVYGATEKTYEKVTGIKGSYKRFKRGLNLLIHNNIPVSLKAIAMRSNVNEIEQIANFCSKYSQEKFKFGPFLHMRYDRNTKRNRLITEERLTAEEIVKLEHNKFFRREPLEKGCINIKKNNDLGGAGQIFTCGILKNGFYISFDGKLRVCPSLWHPDYVRDLKKKTLMGAHREIAENIMNAKSSNEDFLNKCNKCKIFNLCYFCPANSYLETGKLDNPVDYFCANAQARQEATHSCRKEKECTF